MQGETAPKIAQPILEEVENVFIADVPESYCHEHGDLVDEQPQLTVAVEMEAPEETDHVVEDGEDDVDSDCDRANNLL